MSSILCTGYHEVFPAKSWKATWKVPATFSMETRFSVLTLISNPLLVQNGQWNPNRMSVGTLELSRLLVYSEYPYHPCLIYRIYIYICRYLHFPIKWGKKAKKYICMDFAGYLVSTAMLYHLRPLPTFPPVFFCSFTKRAASKTSLSTNWILKWYFENFWNFMESI